MEIQSEIVQMPDKACWLITHSALGEITNEEIYVHHYQEHAPSGRAINVLREDAKIKMQLREGEMNRQ